MYQNNLWQLPIRHQDMLEARGGVSSSEGRQNELTSAHLPMLNPYLLVKFDTHLKLFADHVGA